MNQRPRERLKKQGFLQKEVCWETGLNNAAPSPLVQWAKHESNLGPPPTRPTHITKKANLPNGNTSKGVTKQLYCRVSEPIFPTGTMAPESLAATLHATATESESLRFMGTIKHCLRCSVLSMNRSAEHRLGSLEETVCQLAGAVPGAPIVWFMAPKYIRFWRSPLSMNRPVAQVFQPAGPRDPLADVRLPVPCSPAASKSDSRSQCASNFGGRRFP